jgi:cobalt-zinc-cadmium efflux system membrane fusion protein
MKLLMNFWNQKILVVTAVLLVLMLVTQQLYAEKEPGKDEAAAAAEGEHHDEGHVKLSAQQLQNAGIELSTAGAAAIRETLPLYGVVKVNAERMQTLVARYPGVVRHIVRKAGDKVRPGDVLASVESNESLNKYTLTAAVKGVITERHINEGEYADEQPLFVIADLSNVWVELSVFPRDLARIKTGQTVQVQQAQTGISQDGVLIYLSPVADSGSQTMTARVLLDNSKGQWVPGHFVNADVVLAQTPVSVAVRNDALQTLEGNNVVFVQGEAGFEPRVVRTGRADTQFTEVLEGLAVGETYVARNSFVLKSDLGKEGAEHE